VMALWPILLDGASGTAAVHDELSESSAPVHGTSPCAMFESGQEGPAMPTVITRNPHRLFFMAVGGVVLAIPLIGFAPTYYLKPLFGTPELRPLVQVHAALFTLWPVLVLAQVLLVRARRVDLHRALCWTAVVLVPLMVVTGALVIMGKARPTIEARAFIFTPLLSLVLFPAFVATAIRFRRDPATHKRLMILASVFVVGAGMTRILRFVGMAGHGFLFEYVTYGLILFPCAIYDLVYLRRLHPATIWGGAVIILRHPLHSVVAYTDVWQSIAAWLTAS